MVNYNGGLTKVSQTFQNLYITLDNFNKFGPPSIPVFPISKKEQEFRQYYFQEEYNICDQIELFEEFEVEADNELEVEDEDNSLKADHELIDGLLQDVHDDEVHIHTCCNSLTEEDYKLRDIKYWYKQMEAGTTVEYRCPDCRECSKCKNSDTTDKISLREEVEQKAVEDSVSFDRVNKKVIVSLPKRGKEEFFLSSNRDIAVKVYKKICEKASKNEETKLEINAAFEKLFKHGHAVYLPDIEKSKLDKFINKCVQHYLPW